MKRILLILFLFNFSNAIAQKKPSFFRANPYKKATLNLRNGDSINGLIKLNAFSEILFKKHKDSSKTKYNYKSVKGLTLHLDSIEKKYEYKIIREQKFRGKVDTYYHLLEPVLIGKVSIYLDNYGAYETYNPLNGPNGGFKKNIGYTNSETDHRFYISKNNSDLVSLLGITSTTASLKSTTTNVKNKRTIFDFKMYYPNAIYTISDIVINQKSKSFKKIVEQYFSDCTILTDRIKKGLYDKNGLLAILNFYNKECK